MSRTEKIVFAYVNQELTLHISSAHSRLLLA